MKKILALSLVFCLLIAFVPMQASASANNGTCGDNAFWSLDEATGVLTISGSGPIWDFDNEEETPWDEEKVTSAVIQTGIAAIGNCTFMLCDKMENVRIADTVVSIGDNAFASCTALRNVFISPAVAHIGEGAFDDCRSLGGIWVDENNSTYSSDEKGVLFNKDKSVLILAHLGLRGEYAIPAGVKTIAKYAFAWNELSGITIPDTVTRVEDGAFFEGSGAVTMGRSITYFGDSSFYSCPIRESYISNAVTNIGYCAFMWSGLSGNIIIPGAVSVIRSQAFSCYKLESVTLQEGITAIEPSAFYDCQRLKKVTLPDSLTCIDALAFALCPSLTEITIPKYVTELGEYTFGSNESLAKIYFEGNCPLIYEDTFSDVTATVYYPEQNPTWKESVRRNYGGNLTWVPYSPAAENPFTDVPTDKYYHDPVLWAYENGITTGATATTFNPSGNCTRGQIVTFLWRAAGCPEPTSNNNPFTDVDSDDYFYKAVLWAVETGVTTGATKTTFNPKGACNRGQVVTFMWRAQGKPAISSTENPFDDVPEEKYYHDAVLWAVESGITNGSSATKFAPNSTCTRGQIVTFLYRGYAN